MTQFVSTRTREPPEYGLGLARDDLAGEQVWTHPGDITGFHADLAYIPKHHVTVAALNNYQQQFSGQDALIDALVSEVSHYHSTH